MIKSVPAAAWLVSAFSALTLSTGVCVSMVRSTNLKVEFADLKIDSTAQFSKVQQMANELEQQVEIVRQKEEAIEKLKIQAENLKRHNQPIKMLEPALQELERVSQKSNLDLIQQELENTAQEAAENIESISNDEDSEPTGDR